VRLYSTFIYTKPDAIHPRAELLVQEHASNVYVSIICMHTHTDQFSATSVVVSVASPLLWIKCEIRFLGSQDSSGVIQYEIRARIVTAPMITGASIFQISFLLKTFFNIVSRVISHSLMSPH
jgi:hypothetical protein